ncbi:hypothetical protein PGTUg99_034879 [Puccinia graminis f. sp. tritici]|uniref:Uncharacterized protein n=1 Tax=Puccinia graminis f. sp. tritici TaxID=56615 RepID=A0A5B0SH09_PUCGR|nr:hypothetical protein PGTUg99_034879 [Puccinia graminis f. sp. tritici]
MKTIGQTPLILLILRVQSGPTCVVGSELGRVNLGRDELRPEQPCLQVVACPNIDGAHHPPISHHHRMTAVDCLPNLGQTQLQAHEDLQPFGRYDQLHDSREQSSGFISASSSHVKPMEIDFFRNERKIPSSHLNEPEHSLISNRGMNYLSKSCSKTAT